MASPSIQERKQELVRTAIWEAATDLFAEKGYDETTVDDIAQKAGVSRRSFFRYFSSKSDLMAQGVAGYATYITGAILTCPPGSSPAEIFRWTVLQVAKQCAANPGTRKIMAIAAKYPAARAAHQARTPELQERVEAAYASRCGRGSEGDLTPSVLTALTLSVLSVVFHAWFERGDKDIAKTVDKVLTTLQSLT
jgi:AcrR family transcriptional regulator